MRKFVGLMMILGLMAGIFGGVENASAAISNERLQKINEQLAAQAQGARTPEKALPDVIYERFQNAAEDGFLASRVALGSGPNPDPNTRLIVDEWAELQVYNGGRWLYYRNEKGRIVLSDTVIGFEPRVYVAMADYQSAILALRTLAAAGKGLPATWPRLRNVQIGNGAMCLTRNDAVDLARDASRIYDEVAVWRGDYGCLSIVARIPAEKNLYWHVRVNNGVMTPIIAMDSGANIEDVDTFASILMQDTGAKRDDR